MKVTPLRYLDAKFHHPSPKIKKIPKNTNGRLAIPALAGLLVSDRLRDLGDGVTNRREILYDGTHRPRTDFMPFWGRYPQGNPQIRTCRPTFGSFNCEYLENGKSQCYIELDISIVLSLYRLHVCTVDA